MILAAVDPAWASPLNLVVLCCLLVIGLHSAREMRHLRDRVLSQADEMARIAKGSETRAENAAAEITALKTRIEAMLVEVVVLSHAARSEMRVIPGEWGRIDEARNQPPSVEARR